MNKLSLISSIAAIALSAPMSHAQSLFDFPFSFQQNSREKEKNINVDYGLDMQYYLNSRNFKSSSDYFMDTETLHLARISPSVGVSVRQSRNAVHRLRLGVDLTKNLGENPSGHELYSKDENDPALRNLKLFNEIFYYYNFEAETRAGIFDMYAGIYPRLAMEGDYSRAIFSEETIMNDPNLEGIMMKYKSQRLKAEAGFDWMGQKGLDRFDMLMAYTAGNVSILDWLSAGWAGSYMHFGGSYIFNYDVHNAIFNPYVKFDLAGLTSIQELSLKAGGLISAQKDNDIFESLHTPVAAEGILTVRNWNAGLENTLFYGDNMMPFCSNSYTEDYETDVYTGYLYSGETFYYTRRGFPSGYDRLELFYEPDISSYMKLRFSGVGHLIFPESAVGTFLGWQAKVTLVFSLDKVRLPQKTARRQAGSRNHGSQQRPDSPSFIL